MKTKTHHPATPNKNKKRLFIAGLGVLATTVITFFGLYYWKKHKASNVSPEDQAPEFKAKKPAAKTPPSKPKSKVKTQAANAQKPPSSAQAPKTEKSREEEPSLFEPQDLAQKLKAAIVAKNFLRAYTSLKLIRNTTDYKNVNQEFVKSKIGLNRQTIVTALLGTFKLATQRQLLFNVFKGMGLKYSGNKWTLGDPGNEDQRLITTAPTKVWKDPRTGVSVPSNMLLGREVCKRGNFTLFEHAKNYFLVESNTVIPYKP